MPSAVAPLNVCVVTLSAASPVSVIGAASGGVTHMWPFVLSVVVTVPLHSCRAGRPRRRASCRP